MSGAKRAPSSLVKKATASGCSVSTPASLSVSMTSNPASTPRVAVKTASRANRVDVRTGHDGRSRLPAPRSDTYYVADGIHRHGQAQFAHPSADEIASRLVFADSARQAPPPSMAPIAARSARRRCSRPALTFRVRNPGSHLRCSVLGSLVDGGLEQASSAPRLLHRSS